MVLDEMVRAEPEAAYAPEFYERMRARMFVSVPKLGL